MQEAHTEAMTVAKASVLFAMPPGGGIPSFSEHIGTAFLRAVLAREGIAARQYLPTANPTLRSFSAFLEDQRPVAVGFTAYETNLRACRAMIRTVRETLPDAVVMVGGPNATFTPEETLELLDADLCIRGAAEATIAAIARAILGAEAPRRRLDRLLAGVRNLVGRLDGASWSTAAGDLSSFPGPPYRTLDDLPSPYQDGLVDSTDIGLITARGCNQHCTYCSFAAVSGRRIHCHSVERVLEDLAALQALSVRKKLRQHFVSLLDDAFTLSPRRARAICEGIIQRRLQLTFECVTRADTVDAELLGLMRRAGFRRVGFGLESAIPRVLRTIGKVQSPDAKDDPEYHAERRFLARVGEAIAATREAGLAPTVSIIGGLPGETVDDLRGTLAFVDALGVESYTHNVLSVFPGTPLHRDQARYGIRTERRPVTKSWRTVHAFDVTAVRPLRQADLQGTLWNEARRIADALCGRPRSDGTKESGIWAAVIHDLEPSVQVGAWLREVVEVNCTVVIVDETGNLGPGRRDDWMAALHGAGVPWGLVALLSRRGPPDGPLLLQSHGTLGSHRFEIVRGSHPAERAPLADEAGSWRVPIWIASACDTPPTKPPPVSLADPGPLTADGCRWWSSGHRCADPHVLHLARNGIVRSCWHGPPIGAVGDSVLTLGASGRALHANGTGAPGACPLGPTSARDGEASSAAEAWEVAAALSWALHHDMAARGGS